MDGKYSESYQYSQINATVKIVTYTLQTYLSLLQTYLSLLQTYLSLNQFSVDGPSLSQVARVCLMTSDLKH